MTYREPYALSAYRKKQTQSVSPLLHNSVCQRHWKNTNKCPFSTCFVSYFFFKYLTGRDVNLLQMQIHCCKDDHVSEIVERRFVFRINGSWNNVFFLLFNFLETHMLGFYTAVNKGNSEKNLGFWRLITRMNFCLNLKYSSPLCCLLQCIISTVRAFCWWIHEWVKFCLPVEWAKPLWAESRSVLSRYDAN